MRILALLLVAVVTAGCGPSSGIPISVAQASAPSPVSNPAVVEGDADGHVFEYH